MSRDVLWRAALVQVIAVAAFSLIMVAAVPDFFFERWDWVLGPIGWIACAGVTAWVLKLELPGALLGAVLAGIPSAIAVRAGVHWLGITVSVAAFAAWCAWLARRPGGLLWT